MSPTRPATAEVDRLGASRALAMFLLAGGAFLLLLAVSVPGHAGSGAAVPSVIGIALLLGGCGVAALRAPARIPPAALRWAPPLAVVLIGGLNLATDDATTGSQLFLLWPVLFAASFLDGRRTALTMAMVVAAEGLVLGALVSPLRAAVDTISLSVAYAFAALVILALRGRIQGLVDSLAAQASEDPLTGLPNRRGLDEDLARTLARAGRSREPVAVLAVDVDRFKEINDGLGHAAGDVTLCVVAACLRAVTRETDTVARMGGDEFVVLLPDCHEWQALEIAESLRTEVVARSSAAGRLVTVSVGAAGTPRVEADATALLGAADAALYAAKLAGRNRAAAVPADSRS